MSREPCVRTFFHWLAENAFFFKDSLHDTHSFSKGELPPPPPPITASAAAGVAATASFPGGGLGAVAFAVLAAFFLPPFFLPMVLLVFGARSRTQVGMPARSTLFFSKIGYNDEPTTCLTRCPLPRTRTRASRFASLPLPYAGEQTHVCDRAWRWHTRGQCWGRFVDVCRRAAAAVFVPCHAPRLLLLLTVTTIDGVVLPATATPLPQ